MTFKSHFFDEVVAERLYKPYMEGLNDPTFHDFIPLQFSSVLKESNRTKASEQEYIMSYYESAKILVDYLIQKENSDETDIKSVTIPVIYLSRHCLELKLKGIMRMLKIDVEFEHNLLKLWQTVYSNMPTDKTEHDKVIFNNLESFIKHMNKLDDSGINLRYHVKDKKENPPYTALIWINLEEIVASVKNFIDQLDKLDYEKIRKP